MNIGKHRAKSQRLGSLDSKIMFTETIVVRGRVFLEAANRQFFKLRNRVDHLSAVIDLRLRARHSGPESKDDS
jgi:hypothetical protein